MPRTRRPVSLALALAAVVAAGLAACQDYNFSPVRHCLIQPGTERVTLSDISTADILFVVDDSGSMGGEQQKLKDSFDAFVTSLRTSNVARVASRLEPIDFHIAVTTTSIFLNAQTTATCSTGCGGAAGQQVCCDSVTSLPLKVAKGCAAATECLAGNVCSDQCLGRVGEKTCCAGPGGVPEQVSQGCATVGAACGRLQDRYVVSRTAKTCSGAGDTSCATGSGFTCKNTCQGLGGSFACCDASGITQRVPTCDIGVGTEGRLYPRGDFVAKAGNPKVLHFTKDLFCTRTADGTACACTVPGGPASCDPPASAPAAIATLIGEFKDNVAVGTCGSGQEQGLEAARRALQKALAGTQPNETGSTSPPDWPRKLDPATGRATSKLVVVFVGDEDDCSSPEDVTGGIILTNSGTDACELDGTLPPEQQKRFKLQGYADYLASLGRPVAGAFIVSAKSETCADQSCVADICCDTACTGNANVCTSAGLCGGQGAGFRFLDLEKLLRARSNDTVVGSVCNPGAAGSPGFSSILERVAEVVKQPAGLSLPTQPAASALTLLRIAGSDGKTRKTCKGPAPLGSSVADAEAAGFDWWFTGGDDTDRTPTGPTRFIYLNRKTRSCEANPGETYSADYLGLVPAAGCASSADCQASLGGAIEDWTCDGFTGTSRGTCLCGAP